MSDDDGNATPIDLSRPEEEASRLMALAGGSYTSGDLRAAFKYAKRAHNLHPSIRGLPEMLTAFRILRASVTPLSSSTGSPVLDYYEILGVEQFSHINTIKKQYRRLAMSLHPDKNPFSASAEAFKLVGEAARVLADRTRRKEYDTRLRVALQERATEESGFGAESAVEMFWTTCSTCRLVHQFDRSYLGHNLMCTSCKKTFKAVEIEEGGGNLGNSEKNGGIEVVQTRASARIRAKGGVLGIVEKCGLGVKRKSGSVEGVVGRSRMKVEKNVNDDDDDCLLKDMKPKQVKKVGKLGEVDRGGDEERSVNVGGIEDQGSIDVGVANESRKRRVEEKVRKNVDMVSANSRIEMVESERASRAEAREEGVLTLSQMLSLTKKKKLNEGKVGTEEKGVDAKKLKQKPKEMASENGKENDIEGDADVDGKKEAVRSKKKRGEENGKGYDKAKKTQRAALKEAEMDIECEQEKENEERIEGEHEKEQEENVEGNGLAREKETDKDGGHEKEKEIGNEKRMEEENGKAKEMETGSIREKHERRRVSKYGNLEALQRKSTKDQADVQIKRQVKNTEIEKVGTKKKGGLELMPVEDSYFHDFDVDRRERSFKRGQVWALYDDNDGMPRHYALIDEIVSVNPFEVTLSWLEFHTNGKEESRSRQKRICHDSCGNFKTSKKVSIQHLNLFSHPVVCERAARELYRIYPKKGSIWALYSNSTPDTEGRNRKTKNKCSYDVVICLNTYSDIHGLSVAHLEKVPGFKTVFKRKAIGANAVICVGKEYVKQFSHQIPAKKLSGVEASGLPNNCWELDPASLDSELLK